MASSRGREQFSTTEWSLIVTAADSQNPASSEALEKLCSIYWYPVYGFVRRRGHDTTAAQDLTQEFFARLLEKRSLRAAKRERGRFRSFLLTSVKNFLANEQDREGAAKRGGKRPLLSLDVQGAEARYALEPVDHDRPDAVFEKRWALALLDRTLNRLAEETARGGDADRFARLSTLLTGVSPALTYREVANELGMTEAAVKAAVHRMRKKFGALLREEVARTVDDPGTIDEEIRYLFAAIES